MPVNRATPSWLGSLVVSFEWKVTWTECVPKGREVRLAEVEVERSETDERTVPLTESVRL